MKRFRILKAAVVIIALMFAVTSITYADLNSMQFSDIDSSWAKQHIVNVSSKGLMGGISDTKFYPKENTKNYDAIVSISRMINRDNNTDMVQLEAKYKEKVLDKFNVPAYARKAVALCIEKGIISDFDVSAFEEKPYATKKDISKYLGIAFGIKADSSLPPVVLPFKDSMFIPSTYKPYVKFLMDNKVVNESGDVNGNFNPDEFVTREAFAKMLDLSNSVYENKMLGLGGDINNIGEENSTEQNPIDTGDTNLSVPDEIEEPTVETDEKADVTAYVDQAIPEYGNLAVFVGTERRVYKIAENAVCTLDENTSSYWKLKKSDSVKLYVSDGKVVKIVAESKIRKTVGKLVSIDTADKTILTMETNNGETRKYTITAKTIVIKDAKNALWQELKPGNSLVITTSYDELLEINADGVKSTDKGVIESIVFSRMAPPKIVITALDGSQNTYYANKGIEIAGAGNDVYSLRPGMQVDVSLLDDEISKISVVNTTNETATIEVVLSGQIKQIDTAAKLIVLEAHDKALNKYVEKRIFLTEETRIGDAYLNILSMNDLKMDQLIDVRGTGSVEGIYAKVVQIK